MTTIELEIELMRESGTHFSVRTAQHEMLKSATFFKDATYGEVTSPSACGQNTLTCMHFHVFCDTVYEGVTMDCLDELLDRMCLCNFDTAMAALNATDWCAWGNVSGFYSNLSLCTENISDCLSIPWPNPLVEQTFVDIHHKFFKDCPAEELSDPAPPIVFALVITPILLIPVMVSLVVLKTKNGDGSS
ncbi:receptor activity-modifying protein 2 isoform X5 [Syngnathoides biaculeatus]|uniref:receptor activity-modifying protein 2 isoform X5 n=1 Tax=Syngnathoides biaculeatus TaxID=300417 RepID=UPI002ADE6CBC|nr:receptor activity-modifying protein 2 isoform X5 [Syngnathoides biaculeatus]